MTHPVGPSPVSLPQGRWGTPLAGSSAYLTCYPVWAELPKAQRGLDPPQQGHHVQVFDSAPAVGHQTCAPGSPTQTSLPAQRTAEGGGARRQGDASRFPTVLREWKLSVHFKEETMLEFTVAHHQEWALFFGGW